MSTPAAATVYASDGDGAVVDDPVPTVAAVASDDASISTSMQCQSDVKGGKHAAMLTDLCTRLAESCGVDGTDLRQRATVDRFLRARKYDVDAAETQYVNAHAWRKEHDIDTVVSRGAPPSRAFLLQLVPGCVHGCDKHGRPLYIERTGEIDIERLLNLFPNKEFLDNHVYGIETMFEVMKQETTRRNVLVDTSVNILDLKGMGLAHKQALKGLEEISKLSEDMYPESLGHIFIINTPWVFKAIWAVAKGFVDAHTRSKVHILGGNYKDVLVEHIGAAQLPVEYGGSCECKGAGVPCVPPSGTCKLGLTDLDPPLTTVTIKNGAKHVIELRVDPTEDGGGGIVTKWFFRTASHDIKFGVEWLPGADGVKCADADVVVTLPPAKMSAQDCRVEGLIQRKEPGTVRLTWDNSDSWMTSKTLKFNVTQTPLNHKAIDSKLLLSNQCSIE